MASTLDKPISVYSLEYHAKYLHHEVKTFGWKRPTSNSAFGKPYEYAAWRVCQCGAEEDAGSGFCC